jgi:hypothetical protein
MPVLVGRVPAAFLVAIIVAEFGQETVAVMTALRANIGAAGTRHLQFPGASPRGLLRDVDFIPTAQTQKKITRVINKHDFNYIRGDGSYCDTRSTDRSLIDWRDDVMEFFKW